MAFQNVLYNFAIIIIVKTGGRDGIMGELIEWWNGNDRLARAVIFSYMAGENCPQAQWKDSLIILLKWDRED